MRTITAGLVGVAAVAASLVLLRQPRQVPTTPERVQQVPAGEKIPGRISLERLRELGY